MAFAFFSRWFKRSPRQLSDVRLVVYTRAACPLCDDAIEILRKYQQEYGFTIETIDVDASEELKRDHGNCVPVVAIDGTVRFRGHVNEVLLKRIIQHLG
ncbi:MAG: glutaredoxin family protein [Planctomycetes bacterium]|nr:glutaredoxin family protein [Planctomycetota bacterium]